MNQHFKSYAAVLPVILRERESQEEVLLHRRANTGYMDGKWDFAGSGHVEAGETASQAACREVLEETGLTVRPEAVRFLHLSHRVKEPTYYDIYFAIRQWTGNPAIQEPEKCSDMGWFPVDGLPQDMIANRRRTFLLARTGVAYSEILYHTPEEEETL